MQEIMSPARSLTTFGLMIALGALPTVSAGPVAAQSQSDPVEVTSDTPEYCLYLLDRVSELVRVTTNPVPREVTDLTTEGHRMCAHGQTRSGIMRLRSALLMMEKGDGPTVR